MLRRLCALLLAALALATTACTRAPLLEVVRHRTRVKIIESNNVSLRPGSVYDNITLFESYLGWRPQFAYQFIDTGLGTADPLYPNLQIGYQGSWSQLLAAFWSEDNRHIDHFTTMETPEGVRVDSVYLLRHIDEFPDHYRKERAEGYDLIVIRLEYYTRLHPDAQAGRHRSNPPDPDFDPIRFVQKHLDATTLADFPAEELARFEAKTAALRHIEEIRDAEDGPTIDQASRVERSLWYYPDGYAEDYGIDRRFALPGLPHLDQTRDLVVAATEPIQSAFPLTAVLSLEDRRRLLAAMDGQPVPGFDPTTEPGLDSRRLTDVGERNFYTSGLDLFPIGDPRLDVARPELYRLVGVTFRPFEGRTVHRAGTSPADRFDIPQIRLVYQMMHPSIPERPVEQVFLHIKYDAVDPAASPEIREAAHERFLHDLDRTSALRGEPGHDEAVLDLMRTYATRPVTLDFSLSIIGLWVFGTLDRTADPSGLLVPQRIVRKGVDVGYYSSVFDYDVFAEAASGAPDARRAMLEAHLDRLTPAEYRDPERMNADEIDFEEFTCAQCHHLSGRDAVHLALNDGLDRRIAYPIRASEFLYRRSERELETGYATRRLTTESSPIHPPVGR